MLNLISNTMTNGCFWPNPNDNALNAFHHNTAARNERSTTGYGYPKLGADA